MKISRNKDGTKAIELTTTTEHNSVLDFNGDVSISTRHRDTGETSSVASITQHGAWDFVQRPRVADEEIALKSETGVDISTTHRTIVDNVQTTIVLCPVQQTINVLYSIKNAGCDEKGTLTIHEHNGNYLISAEQHAPTGYFADVNLAQLNRMARCC